MNDIRIENFLYPYVRFLNATPSEAGVDFYRGNSLVAPNVGFGTFSAYDRVSPGTQEFRITRAGNKDDVLATLSLPFEKGEVYTIAAVHSDGSTMAYGISEPTERNDTQYGHLRICNLSPDFGEMNVDANGHMILGGIDYLEISKYMCMTPDKYEFRAKRAKDNALKLVMPNQNLRDGKYNTLYIVGLSDANPSLMGILSVDAASYTGYYL